jgi:hypothetical protein
MEPHDRIYEEIAQFSKVHRAIQSDLMSFPAVDLDRLSALSRLYPSLLATPSDIRAFLLLSDLDKDPMARTIAWLRAFDLISPPTRDLSTLYQNYASKLLSHHTSLSDTRPLVTNWTQAIHGDVVPIIVWFTKECGALALPVSYLHDAELRVARILAVLPIDPEYLQGYDRYVLVCYGLLLRAAESQGVGVDFAEAITYYLSYEFIKIGNFPQFLNGDHRNFTELDREIAAVAPDVARSLSEMRLTSTHFALRWALVLFADEHSLPEIWLLWDAILAHRRNSSEFVRQLSVAHVLQVPMGKYERVIEDLQRNREWNAPELIRVAQQRLGPSKIVNAYDIVVCIIFALIVLWMIHGRFKK